MNSPSFKTTLFSLQKALPYKRRQLFSNLCSTCYSTLYVIPWFTWMWFFSLYISGNKNNRFHERSVYRGWNEFRKCKGREVYNFMTPLRHTLFIHVCMHVHCVFVKYFWPKNPPHFVLVCFNRDITFIIVCFCFCVWKI